METKDKTEENNKRAELLKLKINEFLINYFNYLVLALGIVIFVAGLWLLVYPQYRQISKANEAAKKNLQTEYETKFNYLNSISNLKKSYRLISAEDKSRIAAMVPAGSDVGGLISIIEAIALKNGVVLNSLKIEPDDAKGQTGIRAQAGDNKEPLAGIFEQLPQGVSRIKIEVNLSSVNYPILKNIIKTLENNLRLLDIAKINYSVGESRVMLNIYSYYLPR
jgi:Tfp pilus assembly protein PilO